MKPPFTLNNRILNSVIAISANIGRLEQQYGTQLHLRKQNRIRSIHSSLAIESNALTLEQVTDIINGKRVLGSPQDIREVHNAYAAYEAIPDFNPYSTRDFLKAHRLLMQDLLPQPGHFRSKDVGIFAADGTLLHMGARPQFVPDLVKKLLAWARRDDTPMLVKSTVVHYEIEMIHPFADGNGRMGRLWQSVMLSRWQPLFAWLPVETLVYQNQAGYYHALAEADRANDSTVFVEFMLGMIEDTLAHYTTPVLSDKISDKISDKEQQFYTLVRQYLHTHTSVNNSRLQALTGKSAATIRKYLAALVAAGLLQAEGERKQRIYRLPPEHSNS